MGATSAHPLQDGFTGQERPVKSGSPRTSRLIPKVAEQSARLAVVRGEPEGGAQDASFVVHQQELAQRALCLGSPGAARAALRALHSVDFEESAAASRWLEVLRDGEAGQDLVLEAVKELLRLEPRGECLKAEYATRPTGRWPRLV